MQQEQNPASSSDVWSPPATTSSTSYSLPPPRPLQVFDYPQHGICFPDEAEEDDVEPEPMHRDPRSVAESETEFKHSANSKATVFPTSTIGPPVDDRPTQQQQLRSVLVSTRSATAAAAASSTALENQNLLAQKPPAEEYVTFSFTLWWLLCCVLWFRRRLLIDWVIVGRDGWRLIICV